jgi:hypothetical protein
VKNASLSNNSKSLNAAIPDAKSSSLVGRDPRSGRSQKMLIRITFQTGLKRKKRQNNRSKIQRIKLIAHSSFLLVILKLKSGERDMYNLIEVSKKFHKALNNVKVVANHLTTQRVTPTLTVVTVLLSRGIATKKAK